MRLLNTHTLCLESRTDEISQYAILSHRWEDGEVLFGDMIGDQSNAQVKQGYQKLVDACQLAADDGFDYIWIDTCCIDKGSSSELSEAINSMYVWYREAIVCYAYLSDVPQNTDIETGAAFGQSMWWGRGWTLQELIAATRVIFYGPAGTGWSLLGEKSMHCSLISQITGIDVGVLSGAQAVESVSIAKRMSWASKRVTTRPEDIAYCLIGLFNVNMPMLYGEGNKAFIRLQEEIMKDSDDESLFAWRDYTASSTATMGLLATHPSMFEDSGQYFSYSDWEPRTPFTKTNRGLQISLPLRPVEGNLYVAALNCPMSKAHAGFVGIYLKRLTNFDDAKYENQYARVKAKELLSLEDASKRGQVQKLFVRQTKSSSSYTAIYPTHVIKLRRLPGASSGYKLVGTMGQKATTNLAIKMTQAVPTGIPTAFTVIKAPKRLAAVAVFKREDGSWLAVLLGSFSEAGDVAPSVLKDYDSHTFRTIEPFFVPEKPTADNEGSLRSNHNAYMGGSPGHEISTGRETVQVNLHTLINAGIKYYLTDIEIERNPTFEDFLLKQTPLRQLVNVVPEISEATHDPTRPDKRWTGPTNSKLRNIFKGKPTT